MEELRMYRDPKAFRDRFNRWKEGKPVYQAGRPLPAYDKGENRYQKTIDFLKKHEGFKDTVYLDGKGIPTIGYGFTDPTLISKGYISRHEADKRLMKEIQQREKKLRDTVKGWDNLSDDSKTALLSYHFNYPAGFKDTTKFMQYWNAGDYASAIKEVNAGMNDKNNRGLRGRRLEEQALLMSDPYLNQSTKTDTVYKPVEWKKPVTIPVQIPYQEPKTQYPINIIDRTPAVIDSWNGVGTPAYGGTTPYIQDVQEINTKRNKSIKDTFKTPLLDIDYSPTYSKFEIPKANCGKDKLPRHDEGTPYAVGPYNVYPSALDEQELLNVQTPNINIIGTDRRPLYQRYDAPNSVYDPNAIRNITDWMPGIGDVSQGFDAINAFKNNQYEQAALAGGLLLLPNAFEPAVKPLVRGLSKFKNSIIGKITGSVPPPTYGNGSYSALSRRCEPEELKMFSKKNPIREYYGQNYDQYPEEIKKSIYNSVYNRMNIARNDSEFANDFANAFTQKYTTYSGEPFKRSFGGDMYGGMYFDNSDHIAIRDGKTDYALGHETVHQLDKKLGRTTKEKAFLEDAFDSDFLKGASEHERTTTNYDSRKRFLGNTIDSNSSLDVQNKIIDAATDDEVFDAVSKSNPYGKRYIEEKRKNGQLNSALANKIKESWKYVGMYGGAGGALYMQNDVTEEDLENAMREVGILAPLQSLGLYNKGKDIYIKPSKRGTFTAAAKKRGKSVQGFASQVLANPGKYSKAMRKKAQFARNASKWSH